MPSPLRVCIIGSGVVGQATGRGFFRRGIDVTFVDTNLDKVQQLRVEGLQAYTPTELAKAKVPFDLHIFTVSTPTEAGQIKLEYLQAAARDLGERLKDTTHYQVIVVRSTVVPGTTEDVVAETIEKYSGKKAGRDFGVAMNPEYLREKTSVTDFDQPWIVVIGQGDTRAGDMVARLYAKFDCPVFRVTIKEAETQKYIHNLYNAVKITFFNEFREICRKAGIDPDAIFPLVAKSAEGMWNPQYGIRDFGPFDGMCLPKDTQAFLAWARSQGYDMPLLATAIEVNNQLAARQPHPVPATAKSVPVVAQPLTASVGSVSE